MFEGAGMVLQRRMQISLREVPGIASLGEQRQIGQPELGDQRPIGIEPCLMCCGEHGIHAKNGND